MNKEEARAYLHELVDRYIREEEFDMETKEDWVCEFMEWMEKNHFGTP